MTGLDPGAAIGGAIVAFLNLPVVQTALRFGWLALILGWATAVLWISRDAWRRSGSLLLSGVAGLGMTAATPVLFLPAIPVWLLVRPQVHVADVEERRLTIAALRASLVGTSCPGCQARVNASWQRCPWCRTWLQTPCPRCGRLVESDATVCPFCIAELAPPPLPSPPPSPAAGALWPDRPGAPPRSAADSSPTAPVAVPIVPDPRIGIPIQPEAGAEDDAFPSPEPASPATRRPARPAARTRRTRRDG